MISLPERGPAMAQLARIDDKTSVAGQIQPDDIAGLAETGITMIVNNRPDGEAPDGQPTAREIEATAHAQGLAFVNLPFTAPTLTPDHVADYARLLQTHDGPILAYCRTGNRSSMLWAAAQVALGEPLEQVMQRAEAAGYNLRNAAQFIEQLGRIAATK